MDLPFQELNIPTLFESLENTTSFLFNSIEEDTNCDNLFSFELDNNNNNNNILYELDKCALEKPDFGWIDLLPDADVPVALDDIQPTLFQNNLVMDNDKIKNKIVNQSSIVNCNKYGRTIEFVGNQPNLFTKFLTKNKELSKRSNNKCLLLKHREQAVSINNSSVLCTSGIPKQARFLNNEDLVNMKPGQRIILSAEEKKMLFDMGYILPSKFPLTMDEERVLRTVRRKIRNKLSAQASRSKHQHYVIDLEQRYRLCNQENRKLRNQIASLQNDKKDLSSHLQKLRSYINKWINNRTGTQPQLNDTEFNGNSILPLYLTKQAKRSKFSSTSQATAVGGTSLFVVTFMALIWTTIIPLPKVNFFDSFKYTTDKNVFNKTNINIFPGQSRFLMANERNTYDVGTFEDSNFDKMNVEPLVNDSDHMYSLYDPVHANNPQDQMEHSNLEPEFAQMTITNIPVASR